MRIKKGNPRVDSFGPGIFFVQYQQAITGTILGYTLINDMKQQILFPIYITIFFLLAKPCAFAEPVDGPLTLDTIVVVEKREDSASQTGDVDPEQTPAFFSVIKREQFEGKMEDLSEVIEKEVGIQVRQSGGLGSFSTVSLRGSSSEQVMVYIDGILLNDASGGGVDLSNISLSDVEAIEVYRGMTPVNFGKASIGGVINIRTIRSKEGLKGTISSGFGSFKTRELAWFVNHKPGRWDYLISADYLASDNDFDFLNDNGTEWNKADDRWEERNNADFDQENVLVKAGFDVTADVRMDIVNQWFSKDQGLPSWNNSESAKTSLDTKRNIATLKLTANDIGAYHLNTSVRLECSWKKEEYDDRHGHIGLGNQRNDYTTTRYGAGCFVEWLTDWNTLNIVADIWHEKYKPEDLLGSQDPRESSRDTLSFGLQDSVGFFQERLIITPALRSTAIKDELKSSTSSPGMPLEGRSRDESYFSPQIGLKLRIL
ncbi:MAG: TonB-dependent receptor plug domain-containing protein, partial [Thermodesulfobacteriota bacterium]|nr:TonB-dependent receptor plug domain-containing protein [Thermodesulfobacteriota bacterium]